MGDFKRGWRMAWRFLLSAITVCLASGAAIATCAPASQSGAVPCYLRVQPIDVANTQTLGTPATSTVVYNLFNSTSKTVKCPLGTSCPSPSTTAGITFQPVSGANIPASIPNNSTSSDPIGFVVQPATAASPGSSLNNCATPTGSCAATDVTRVLLNQLGIDLVWLPMTEYVYPACPILNTDTGATNPSCRPAPADFTTLNVTPAPAMRNGQPVQVASCMGYISGTTLTITSNPSNAGCTVPGTTTTGAALAAYNLLSGGTILANTYVTASLSGAGGVVGSTYSVNPSQTVGSVRKPVLITATLSTLTSSLFKTLSQQDTSVTTGPNEAISIGGTPAAPLGGGALTPAFSPDPTIVNMFFVDTLNPPTGIGGNLYGLAWICNNGVAISSTTFGQSRPDTLAHELLHNLCLDHTTYGAGPWTSPASGTPSSGTWAAPNGIATTILSPTTNSGLPNTPLPGECDSKYPECGANLMTTGLVRNEPTLGCILADPSNLPAVCKDTSGNQMAGFYNTNPLLVTDRLNFPNNASSPCQPPAGSPPLSGCSTQLPASQQAQVIEGADRGLSGLLSLNSPQLQFSGLLSPIPQETTKAQLGTSGSSAGRAIFDLSSPAGGKPGETLLGWVLTLPRGQSFSRHDGFHIVSQSREDLVQDVKYYPGPENNPLTRNIAYQRGGDNNANDPTMAAADQGPCAFTPTECLVVKFQPPGLGADESISFSNSILSGDAPITNEDLCKAKITYIFSDGYVTTSNFGVCPPAAPLIANSWHPDPEVAPHVVQSNLLLAQASSSLGCTPDPVTGKCPDVDTTSISDADALQEAGAPQRSCDNGATMRGSAANPVTGTINASNIIITGGQTCHYQGCDFVGNLTINDATAYLENCGIAGKLTMNSGHLYLLPQANPQDPNDGPVTVFGNISIGNPDNLPNSFSIVGATVKGTGVIVQNVPSGGLGYVCGGTFAGNVNVNNNMSPIQIGGSPMQCPVNFIGGHLNCKGNTPSPTGGGNSVQNGATGQCAGF